MDQQKLLGLDRSNTVAIKHKGTTPLEALKSDKNDSKKVAETLPIQPVKMSKKMEMQRISEIQLTTSFGSESSFTLVNIGDQVNNSTDPKSLMDLRYIENDLSSASAKTHKPIACCFMNITEEEYNLNTKESKVLRVPDLSDNLKPNHTCCQSSQGA